jgi:hypothetical protein
MKPGKVALQMITGINRLKGRYGAMEWYVRFMAEHRAGFPPEGISYGDWKAIALAWAERNVNRLLQGNVPLERIMVDETAFRRWREGHWAHLERPTEEQGTPEIVHPLPRGYIAKGGKVSKVRRSTPPPHDYGPDGEIEWTDAERKAGIPQKITRLNFGETAGIVNACAYARKIERAENDSYLMRKRPDADEYRHHATESVPKDMFSEGEDPKEERHDQDIDIGGEGTLDGLDQ